MAVKLRAEITAPLIVNDTFAVQVTIYNDGDTNARVINVHCVLNGGWPAGEFPGRNLVFAHGERAHKNLGGGWPPPGLGAGESANLTWNVVCKIPGDWVTCHKEKTGCPKERYQNGWRLCEVDVKKHPKEDYQEKRIVGKAKIRINPSAIGHIGNSATINMYKIRG